jgi:hypothetical protein
MGAVCQGEYGFLFSVHAASCRVAQRRGTRTSRDFRQHVSTPKTTESGESCRRYGGRQLPALGPSSLLLHPSSPLPANVQPDRKVSRGVGRRGRRGEEEKGRGGRERYEAVELRVCKWLLHRGRCTGCNYGLRRAGAGVGRRKWWSGKGLRGSVSRGRRRKWWFAGGEENGEFALMATWDVSRWGIRGCDEKRIGSLDIALTGDTY